MKSLRYLICLFFNHDYQFYLFRKDRALARCRCCDRRWAVAEDIFYRYDNDPNFKWELQSYHPELKDVDI
jgi:hypothetical protein